MRFYAGVNEEGAVVVYAQDVNRWGTTASDQPTSWLPGTIPGELLTRSRTQSEQVHTTATPRALAGDPQPVSSAICH